MLTLAARMSRAKLSAIMIVADSANSPATRAPGTRPLVHSPY